MDRYWLLTWTTYGTWLPGDAHGFVTDLRGKEYQKYRRNEPGTECAADVAALHAFSKTHMRADPILLERPHAEALQAQLLETAQYRGWQVLAAAVMANHVHVVVGVCGDPEPETLLQSFKSYGSPRAESEVWSPGERDVVDSFGIDSQAGK